MGQHQQLRLREKRNTKASRLLSKIFLKNAHPNFARNEERRCPAKSGARLILPGHINRLDTCGSTLLSPDYLPLYLGTAALIQTFVAIPFLVAHDQIEKLDKDVSRELQKSTKILIPSPLSTAGKCVAATSFGVYVLAHVLFYPGKARGIIAFLSRFSLALGLELASVGSSKKDKLIGISCTSSLFVACEIWMRVFKKDLT